MKAVKLPRVSERQEQAKRGRSKFGAVRTEVDGVTFASKAEARRYSELKLLEKAKRIRDLTLQPRFPLEVIRAMETVVIGEYIGDFAYEEWIEETSRFRGVVEDVKGFKTPLYRWKKKHVEAQYGITVVEIRTRG